MFKKLVLTSALVAALVATVFVAAAVAQAPQPPILKKTAASLSLPNPPCSVSACSGFYVGAGMAGNGTNADILGNGVSGSVFAGGGIPFVDGGWQSWNGTMMFGVEAGVGYQINTATAANGVGTNLQGVDAYQEIQLGGNLSNLVSGQQPVMVPTGLMASMMFPYVAFGAEERQFADGWRTGAGAKFLIGPEMFLDIGYRYINYGAATSGALSFPSENLVFLKFNRVF